MNLVNLFRPREAIRRQRLRRRGVRPESRRVGPRFTRFTRRTNDLFHNDFGR